MAKYYEEKEVNGMLVRFYYDNNGNIVQAEKVR